MLRLVKHVVVVVLFVILAGCSGGGCSSGCSCGGVEPLAEGFPTERRVEYAGIAIDRIVDGKVVQMWHLANSSDLQRQLTN